MPGQSFRGFAEKVVLVTNSDSRVGRAVALQLALEGAYVVAHHSPGSSGKETIRQLIELGTLAMAFEADLGTKAGIDVLYSSVGEAYGRLDHLVVVPHDHAKNDPAPKPSDEEWDTRVSLPVKSTYFTVEGAAPLMKGRPSPAIVAVLNSSTKGNVAESLVTSSLESICRLISQSNNVRFNCVSYRIHSQTDPQVVETRSSALQPDDIARACVFLLSNDSEHLRGQTLTLE